MHFGDSIFIFLMALVLFGPKKLPEIGRQIGKLLGEFRRASNEFKYQIQEELRNMEDEERRKKLADEEAARTAKAALEAPLAPETSSGPSILPPSTGTQVSTERPYATPVDATAGETTAVETTTVETGPGETGPGETGLVEAGLVEAGQDGHPSIEAAAAEAPAAESAPLKPEAAAVDPYSSLSAADVLAEPPSPADDLIAPLSPDSIDLNTPTNGTHFTAQESSVDAGATGEHVHHG